MEVLGLCQKNKIKIIKAIIRIVTIIKIKIITREIITVNNFIFQIIRDVKLSGYSFYKLLYIISFNFIFNFTLFPFFLLCFLLLYFLCFFYECPFSFTSLKTKTKTVSWNYDTVFAFLTFIPLSMFADTPTQLYASGQYLMLSTSDTLPQ